MKYFLFLIFLPRLAFASPLEVVVYLQASANIHPIQGTRTEEGKNVDKWCNTTPKSLSEEKSKTYEERWSQNFNATGTVEWGLKTDSKYETKNKYSIETAVQLDESDDAISAKIQIIEKTLNVKFRAPEEGCASQNELAYTMQPAETTRYLS